MSEPIDENFFDADDIKRQQDAEKDARLNDAKLLDYVRWVISEPKGRRFMGYLLDYTGILQPSYTPKDAHQTAYNEGRRDVGLRLMLLLRRANPKAYSQIDDERLAELGKKRKGD